MAAQPSRAGIDPAGGPAPLAVEVIDLRRIRAGGLDSLLEEEASVWMRELQWDFAPSAELIRRLVDMRSLAGRALLLNGEIAGYTYTVLDGNKGLVGDLFLKECFRSPEYEDLLLDASVRALLDQPGVRRVESQILLFHYPRPKSRPFSEHLRLYPRYFMSCPLPAQATFPVNTLFAYETWEPRHTEPAAELINEAYDGHIDSQLNDQYRSLPGARLFLQNIVSYPGCGTFLPAASFVARSMHTGQVLGVCLVSRVSPAVGHITQLCVAPDMHGRGIGRSLLQKAFDRLERDGCRQVSLTVTAANEGAVRLYRQCGFRVARNFAAYVWDGFRSQRKEA